MFFESLAIVIVIFLTFVIFLREHRTEYAKTAAILMILPGTYALSHILSVIISKFSSIDPFQIVFFATVIGLVLSCVLIGAMSYNIKKKSLRIMYASVNSLFVLILAMIMMLNISFLKLK